MDGRSKFVDGNRRPRPKINVEKREFFCEEQRGELLKKVAPETKQLGTVGLDGQYLYFLVSEWSERFTVYTVNCSVYSEQCTG